MKLSRFVIVSAVLLMGAHAGVGQDPGGGGGSNGPGSQSVQNRNLTLMVSVGGLTNGQKISGTNILVQFTASAASVDYDGPPDPWVSHEVIAFTPKIEGETISPPPGDPPPTLGRSFATRFHSNHFDHGDTIELTLSATFRLRTAQNATSDVTVSTSIPLTANVYNYGTCFGISSLEHDNDPEFHGVPSVAAALGSMKHYVTQFIDDWTESTLEAEVKKCTVFYSHSHGNSVPRIWGQGSIAVDYTEVKSWLQAATSPHVPVNLAFIDACDTATYVEGTTPPGAGQDPDDPTLNHGFSTNGFLYETAGGTCIDRAQVGWRVTKLSEWTKTTAIYFWGALAAGKTVHEARDDAIEALRTNFGSNVISLSPQSYLAVFGDYFMRLWGVYTGDDTPKPSWYYSFY